MPALGAWTPCCCPFLCPTQSSRNDRFERGDLESRSPLPSATQRPGVIKRAGYQRMAAHNAIAHLRRKGHEAGGCAGGRWRAPRMHECCTSLQGSVALQNWCRNASYPMMWGHQNWKCHANSTPHSTAPNRSVPPCATESGWPDPPPELPLRLSWLMRVTWDWKGSKQYASGCRRACGRLRSRLLRRLRRRVRLLQPVGAPARQHR